jgi:uncharacterized protein (TIGR00730 family)
VFCSSSVSIDSAYIDLADQVGAAIAARGWDLVTGGGRVSMMGAVARAVRRGGGRTTGVIPNALTGYEVADDAADDLLVVEDMRRRKAEMDVRADAFLALPGGIGTLEELLEVWTSRALGMHAKPVVVLDPAGVFATLQHLVGELAQSGFVRASGLAAIAWTSTVGDALDACAPPPTISPC